MHFLICFRGLRFPLTRLRPGGSGYYRVENSKRIWVIIFIVTNFQENFRAKKLRFPDSYVYYRLKVRESMLYILKKVVSIMTLNSFSPLPKDLTVLCENWNKERNYNAHRCIYIYRTNFQFY